jgi:hypothetical protein
VPFLSFSVAPFIVRLARLLVNFRHLVYRALYALKTHAEGLSAHGVVYDYLRVYHARKLKKCGALAL